MRLIFFILILIFFSGCSSPGWDYLEKKDYRAAEGIFHQLLGENSKPGTFVGLYKSYVGLGKIDSAEFYINEGLSNYPDDKFINYCAGQHFIYNVHNDSLGIAYMRRAQKLFGSRRISDEIEKEIQSAVSRAK